MWKQGSSSRSAGSVQPVASALVASSQSQLCVEKVFCLQVVVGEGHCVEAGQQLTLCRQRATSVGTASDDELEYAGSPPVSRPDINWQSE